MTEKQRNVSKRNYLKEHEVNDLLTQAKKDRESTRNQLIILLLYRHGLRVSELCDLEVGHIDFKDGLIEVFRLKGSKDTVQPMQRDTIYLIKKYLKERKCTSNYLICSQSGSTISRITVTNLIKRLSKQAKLPIIASAHTLRHSCGYYLANKDIPLQVIQDYLGHKDANNTRKYTQLSSNKFRNLWK